MKLARWVFLVAGILGLLLVAPVAYSALDNGQGLGPDLSGLGLFFVVLILQHACWQIVYLVLAGDPARYRGMMIPAFLAAAFSALNPAWLYLYGYRPWLLIVAIDLALSLLILLSYWLTGRESNWSAA